LAIADERFFVGRMSFLSPTNVKALHMYRSKKS